MSDVLPSAKPSERLLRQVGLRYVTIDELTIRRRRRGAGFIYVNGRNQLLRDQRLLYQLKRLAVPPAYENVLYATDPHAHLQAIGRDAAGRAQYRYHPDWEKIRELRKARRLARLAEALPNIRSWVSRHLGDRTPSRELVALTALRPGSATYARQHGTRGAVTLLKSNVRIGRDRVSLRFTGKGGKSIEKEVHSARLALVLRRLAALPGSRLFQHRNQDGIVVPLRRRDVNAELHDIAGRTVSLKDFRTLIACARALEQLAGIQPKASERGRRRQLLATMRAVSADLANTPAVCRKSYVHAAVVSAFESGALQRIARGRVSAAARERLLVKVLARIAP